MDRLNVLLEFEEASPEPFELQLSALSSFSAAESSARSLFDALPGLGLEIDEDVAPVPMFIPPTDGQALSPSFVSEMNRAAFEADYRPDVESSTVVVPARVSPDTLDALRERSDVKIWPNSDMELLDGVSPASGVDCRPFQPGATIEDIQRALGIESLWQLGSRGEGIVVGIIDEGVNGHYPVIGGFARPGAGRQPGGAPITSHGSMCAADILIAAPEAKLYDYPFLGVPNSGGALQMFQAVLNQRAIDGTPHVVNNSYGFTGVPNLAQFPNHEVHDLNHPLHRKIREVVLAGVACLFAAGNCGADCPSGNCQTTGIGTGKSIHASNSLEEVITIAAVNQNGQRIGYSSQGPGMFFVDKPDLACFSHIFANFGPGRPGGLVQPFDNGTSAATPVAAGVVAALIGAFPGASPARLKNALIRGVRPNSPAGWNRDFGYGILHVPGALGFLP